MTSIPAIPGLTEHLAVLLVACVVGLLLFFGGKLLRPAVLLAALVVSGALGLRLAGAELNGGLLGLPPAVWAIGIPLLGTALAFVLYRLCLAGLFGASAAVAGFLVTVTFVSLAGNPGSPPALVVPETVTAALDEEVIGRVDLVLEHLSERLDTVLATASGWIASHSSHAPANVRMLGLVVATVCGVIGLALGLLMPERVARIATVVIGSWMLVVAGTSLWGSIQGGVPSAPPSAILVGWCVLAAFGAFVQSRQRRPSTDETG